MGLFPLGDSYGVLAVADGLGGAPLGEQASRTLIETIAESLYAEPLTASDRLREAILDGVETANSKIIGAANNSATTLALVEVQGRTIRPYHVGDSVVLVFGQRGKVKVQTVSHSPMGYAVESGFMEEDEALQHEERHVVSNVVGSEEMRLEIGGVFEMAPRDTMIIATDGLVDNLAIQEVVEIARKGPLDKAVQQLIDACRSRMSSENANEPGHADDLTILAFRLSGV